jgi:preprotein translocase SecE subunit
VAKASKKADDSKKPKKVVAEKTEVSKSKRQQTVRERSQRGERGARRRIRNTAGRLSSPITRVRITGKKEYHLPLPDNRAGTILKKRVRLVPKFLRLSWQEIRLVTWPNASETIRLTSAVFIFAVIFALIVGALDFGLDKLFREVIIKR